MLIILVSADPGNPHPADLTFRCGLLVPIAGICDFTGEIGESGGLRVGTTPQDSSVDIDARALPRSNCCCVTASGTF